MALPSQTFSTLAELINYINTKIIPNGMREIDGEALNNALNALAQFIEEYTVNGGLLDLETDSGIVIEVSKPMTVFIGAPTSVQWPNNPQNEYYLVNATGYDIPLSAGFVFVDAYQDEKNIIPANQVVHIAKAPNGSWIQVNNFGGSTGGGLPPQAGNSGKILATNGSSAFWVGATHRVTSSNFSSATECPLPALAAFDLEIFWVDLPNFTFQWTPLVGGGFEMTAPGFDANAVNYTFILFLKAKT